MQPLEQFHRYAIKYQLSVTAVLLWQQVYFMSSEKGSYTKVQLSTSVLQALLQVTRSGLQGARQSLINKGLLVIEQDEQQNIAYTLKLAWIDLDILLARWEENHGKPLDETGRKAMAEPLAEPAYQMEMPDRAATPSMDKALVNQSAQDQSAIEQTIDNTYGWSVTEQKSNNNYGWSVTEQKHDDSYGWSATEQEKDNTYGWSVMEQKHDNTCGWPTVEQHTATSKANSTRTTGKPSTFCKAMPAHYTGGDVLLNGSYRSRLAQFTEKYNSLDLRGKLESWITMRQENGWTLGSWGLDTLLEKLVMLGNGEIKMMAAIVKQSLERRWKGFHKLRMGGNVSGEKLRQQEAQTGKSGWQQQNMRPQNHGMGGKFVGGATDWDLSFLEE